MTSSLPSDSFTARRLEHATPDHLHLTTRRTFIGPIPQGWLKGHRKEWYRTYLGLDGDRAPTFTAAQSVAADETTSQHEPVEPVPAIRAVAGEDDTPRHSSGTDLAATTSSTSLLHRQHAAVRAGSGFSDVVQQEPTAGASRTKRPDETLRNEPPRHPEPQRQPSRLQVPHVRFSDATKLQLRSRAQRLAAGGNFRRSKVKAGELMKVEKMLVRIDITGQSLASDFNERLSQGVETRSLDKWREYMVVARKHEDGAMLQFYQTRVIASTADKTKKRPKAQLLLLENGSGAKVNMYSSLDKTLCVWNLERATTYIYYLRPLSGASSVEWFTFLRGLVGVERTRTLQINVPDLSVSLRLDDPFRTEALDETLAKAADGNEDALFKAITDEKGAAGAIVNRCVDMLKQSPEWADILKAWAHSDRIGLAWKRYDRLEWVHGAVEQRMWGTVAMQRTHDLELRPKDHYPMTAKTPKGKILHEPPPIEGFLIRLTSQKGQERRLGRMLFKRLYFTTQNNYMIFLQPSKASPPPPPSMPVREGRNVPSSQQLADKVPLVYNVEPYPLDGEGIAWLDTEGVKSSTEQEKRDKEASVEAERNTNMLMACDGFIDMRDIKRVRKFKKGAAPTDEDLESGSDVDFHQPISGRDVDGNTDSLEEERVFELLLKNGLVIRLQAYNEAAKKEWMTRLRQLVKYWHHRTRADMDHFKSVREQNLKTLEIDERAEAQVGSFAYKWEVSQSFASPTMYNMCGIASCRTIHLSGLLFRKPRRHTTFSRCHVILAAGHLLIFRDSLRKRTGEKLVHIHHERIASVDLRGCYLYSGLLTENDLLYQNRTFDSNMPGHHALPRVYLEDSWTSTDEDAMTTFVIWHTKSKSWFRSSHFVDDARRSERESSRAQQAQTSESLRAASSAKTKTKLERVSKLGATGRSVVFKARSRAERDHWVLAIQVEIERLAAQTEEVRLEKTDGGS